MDSKFSTKKNSCNFHDTHNLLFNSCCSSPWAGCINDLYAHKPSVCLFPTHKVVFKKGECAVRMGASYAFFRLGVHTVLAKIAAVDMIKIRLNISF